MAVLAWSDARHGIESLFINALLLLFGAQQQAVIAGEPINRRDSHHRRGKHHRYNKQPHRRPGKPRARRRRR